MYELLLSQGKTLKKCTVCNRGMGDHEIHDFEKNVRTGLEYCFQAASNLSHS